VNALADLLALETPLKPTLDPRVYVEPKDRDPASEDDRQSRFVNRVKRGQWERNKAMREGLAIGWPDVGIVWAGAEARIEFKNGSEMPRDEQIETLNWLVDRGHPVAVCRTADGALRWLGSIGAPL
jgi:hypothetical protein